ncbi:MAG TPA: bacillithiol biosynthesis cysteine-adding enzyme BshC [Thermoanaerobaculia bacterium]|nr:bacillithiol biosynthesis cysteine-adding enzyme BshC [Thermoanaerobaculia bacterium]
MTLEPDSGVLAPLDLLAHGLLPPIPAAFLAGRELDLLAPLRFAHPDGPPSLPQGPGPDRKGLAAGLATANRAYGHPAADALAEKLTDPRTRVVATGQQPGLFGGPLYALSKMVAASRWAARLEAAGESAVAVFWVATEDHDWAEVAQTTLLSQGGLRRFDLGPDPEPLAPLGTRTLGPEMARVHAEIAEAFPGPTFTAWRETLARWYRPDARFGEAFCRLMAHLLGPRCPLLLDAMLPELKTAERPHLRRLVEERAALEAAYAAQDAEIERRGLPLQVAPQRGLSPLFLYTHGERRRIEWRGADRYALRGRDGEFPVEQLLAAIDENPGVVSPGVLARPAIQDAVLGSSILLLGPGEASYIPQVVPAYRTLGIEGPAVALRPQVTLVEAATRGRLEALDLTFERIVADPGLVERRLAERGGGEFVAPVRDQIAALLETLSPLATAIDPSLDKPLDKTREQALRGLDLFADKVRASAARKNEVEARRAGQLLDLLRPNGKLQERELSSAQFATRAVESAGEALWEGMDLDPRNLQAIELPAPPPQGTGGAS